MFALGERTPELVGDQHYVAHNATIIGHKVMLHGCTIGSNSLIGIGSVVMNGAIVGRDSIVGAHALVTEKKAFPDGSLILGSPAQLVRTLTPSEIAANTASAEHCVANARRFREALREI